MAYSVVPLVSTGDLWTAAMHNTYIKDNFAALKALIDTNASITIPAAIAAKGSIPVGSGAGAFGNLLVGTDRKTLEALSSQAYGMQWSGSHGAKIRRTTPALSVANNTNTVVTGFDTLDYDPDGMRQGGNPELFTIPISGIWRVSGVVQWDKTGASAGTLRQVGVGVNNVCSVWDSIGAITSDNLWQAFTRELYIYATDYVSLNVLQKNGGALNLVTAEFAISFIR